MNIITRSLVSNFLNSLELPKCNDADDFEKFSAYSVVRKVYGHEFNLDDVLVGRGGDLGIDALAIIVNGALVTTLEEIHIPSFKQILQKNLRTKILRLFVVG